jgi:hypothetical protein
LHAAIAATGVAIPQLARADAGRRPALHWARLPGAEHCIDPRSLAQRVESITGAVFVPASSADISIEAQIESPAAAQFTLHIRLTSSSDVASNERVASFSTAECRTLDSAIAFLIAMAIDPDLATSAVAGVDWLSGDPDPASAAEQLRSELRATQPGPRRDVLAEPVAPAPQPTTPAPEPQPEPELRYYAGIWQVGAALGGGYGPMSSPTLGVFGFASYGLAEHFALGAQLRAAFATNAFEVDAVRSVGTQHLGAALLACTTWFDPAGLGLSACLGPEVMLLVADGDGFETSSVAAEPSFSGAARIELQHRLDPRWSLTGALLGELDTNPRTVSYVQEGKPVALFRPNRFAVQAALGIAYAF